MIQVFISLAALLMSVAILLVGNGLQATLIVLRANLEGFDPVLIGFLTSGYFAGFILGCFVVPKSLLRVGHIRTFAVFAAIASAAALAHALVVDVVFWWFLRSITGFCFAALFVVIESWLNEQSSNENRGSVISVYRITDISATIGGQLLLNVADPSGFALFSLVAIFICVALVPVTLTTKPAPVPHFAGDFKLKQLVRKSPVGVAGCLGAGLVNGSFWGLAPLFAQGRGLEISSLSVFMSLMLLGGALFQWPVGYLSDRLDRRVVLMVLSLSSSLAGLVLWGSDAYLPGWLFVFIFFFGGFSAPMYSIAIAHANDHLNRHEFVKASSGLLLIYGIGAVIGPFVSALFVQHYGADQLFSFSAVIHMILAIYIFYRLGRRRGARLDDKSQFQPIPRTTPMVFEIDPRGDKGDDEGVRPS